MTPRQAKKLKPGDIVAPRDEPALYLIVMSNAEKQRVIQFTDMGCLEYKELGHLVQLQPRDEFTDEEHLMLVNAGTEFARHLAAITAKQLNRFDIRLRGAVLRHLQEKTSLFNPYTNDRIKELMFRHRERLEDKNA